MGSLEKILLQCIENHHQNYSGICRASGVSKRVLSRFKNGKQSLKLETVEKLLKYFRIRITIPRDLKEPSRKVSYNKTKTWYAALESRRSSIFW